MIKITNLSKISGSQTVFENINLSMTSGEKVRLIGPHNSGKSILLRIILGLESYQQGAVLIRPYAQFGYLPQRESHAGHHTVGDVIKMARQQTYYPGNGARTPGAYPFRTEELLDQIQAEVLMGLNLQQVEASCPLKNLKASERYRVWLASLLITNPEVLVLDEPAEQLCPSSFDWLASFLAKYEGAVLVTSCEQGLYKSSTDKTWEIIPTCHSVKEHSLKNVSSLGPCPDLSNVCFNCDHSHFQKVG